MSDPNGGGPGAPDPDELDPDELDCHEFAELVTEYLEGSLEPLARRRFEDHLAECPGCASYLEQIREATRVLGRVSLDTISPAARDQLMGAFRSWRFDRADPAD